MEQLGTTITSSHLDGLTKEVYRLAVRGIILQDGKLLMVYCKAFNDYTFPGGGVEKDEDELVALGRECREEVGAIIDNPQPFYKICERRETGLDTILNHESRFYLCNLVSRCEPQLEEYEKEFGYEARWITIDEAISYDEDKMKQFSIDDYVGVIERELRILYKLKEIENNKL